MHNCGTSDVLQHYGVPGMKWGVRKDRRSGSSTKRRSKRNSAPDKGTSIKRTVKSGVSKGADFVKDNKKTIIVAGVSAAMIASGHAYVTPFINLAVSAAGAATGAATNQQENQRR